MYSKFRTFRKGHASLQVWDMFTKDEKKRAGQVAAKPHRVAKEELCSKLIGKDDEFTVFENDHMDEAARIIEILLKAPTFEEFVSISADLRKELNEQLYIYCVSVASSHRKDTKRTRLPPIYQSRAKDFFKDKNKKYSEGEGVEPAAPTAPEEPAAPKPEAPPAPAPEQPTTQPEKPATPAPEETPAPAPEKPPTPVPEEPSAPAPEEQPEPTPAEPPAPAPETEPAPEPEAPTAPEPAPEPAPEEPPEPAPETEPPAPAPEPEKPPTPAPEPAEPPAPEPEPEKPPTPAPEPEKPPTPAEPEKPPTPAPEPEKPPTPVEPEKPPTPAPEPEKPPTPAEPEKPPTPAPEPAEPVAPEPAPVPEPSPAPAPEPVEPPAPAPEPSPRSPRSRVPVSEEVMDYFREDVCLNSHHWHWHVVYPSRLSIQLDRRGELFFHMHRQMLARYDAERLSHDMDPVKPFSDFTEPLMGYDPELAYRWHRYPLRRPNLTLTPEDVDELDGLRNSALESRTAPNMTIDEYGTLVERGIHNRGHVLISRVGNTRQTGRPRGVMLYTQTAIRDPMFYRWHKLVDDVIQLYLDDATPYTDQDLTWPGMDVERVEILNESQSPVSELKTFTNTTDIDLSFSLDLRTEHSRGITETVTHQDHESFYYRIHVRNTTESAQWATVRVFMLPVKDGNGQDYRMSDFTTKSIEMDRFTHRVPVGEHTFVRSSGESSVCIPWEQSFTVLYGNIDDETDPDQENEEDYCGCGWPEHLQIPRGKQDGMPFRIVVMITDWEQDKVYRDNVAPSQPEDLIIINDDDEPVTCKNAASYCGRKGLRYPDKRAMGFPFDKPFAQGQQDLESFIRDKGNMQFAELSIRHT